MATLEIRVVGEEPFVHDLVAERTTIGRSISCDVVVPDIAMSRCHAAVFREKGRYFIEDLRSRHGVVVNNESVSTCRALSDRDEISLGTCKILFQGEVTEYRFREESDLRPRSPDTLEAEPQGRDTLRRARTEPTLRASSPSRWVWGLAFLALAILVWSLFAVLALPAAPASMWGWGLAFLAVAIVLAGGLSLRLWLKNRGARAPFSTQARQQSQPAREEPATVESREPVSAERPIQKQASNLESLKSGLVSDPRALPDQLTELAKQLVEIGDVYRQLDLARLVQKLLLPRKAPSILGYRIFGDSQPCYAVGGDFFDYLELPGGNVGIVLGDVSGKGLGSALLAHYTQAAIRTALRYEQDLGRLFTALNDDICTHSLPNQFVTVCVCLLKPAPGEISFVNAGHCPPLLVQQHGETRFLEESSALLGVSPDFPYDSHRVRLDPNSAIVLYSDGITECQNGSDLEFGLDGLAQFFSPRATRSPEEIMRDLETELERFGASASQADDITLLLLQRAVAA